MSNASKKELENMINKIHKNAIDNLGFDSESSQKLKDLLKACITEKDDETSKIASQENVKNLVNSLNQENQDEKKLNIQVLETMLNKAIESSIAKRVNTVSVSFCANPLEDNGSRQFLISQNRNSFGHYYDSEIINLLNKANYKNVKVYSKRDSMSGVLHYIVSFDFGMNL